MRACGGISTRNEHVDTQVLDDILNRKVRAHTHSPQTKTLLHPRQADPSTHMPHKPDLILHIGHGKTGSTSIQRSLQQAPDALRRVKILMADADGHTNHQRLFAHLTGVPKTQTGSNETSETALTVASRLWRNLQNQIETQRPETVVISCENQFRPFDRAVFDRMNGLLHATFKTTRVVCYLRAPVSYFLSAVQQDLKKNGDFVLPSANRFRDTLEPWQTFGPGPITARKFDRAALDGGNVVTDFCTHFLPALDPATLGSFATEENTTLSGEAMQILQGYFRGDHRAPHAWYAHRAQRFKALVRRADAATPGGSKPKLHVGLDRVIDARTADLDWVATQFGVTFPEIPAATLPQPEAEARYQSLRNVADVCAVDPGRLTALQGRIDTMARAEQAPLQRLRRLLLREPLR